MADTKLVEIWDSNAHYKARMNINETLQHNRPTSSQVTLNSKYPYHIHDGKPSYYSGSCTATFVDNNDCYVTSEEDVAEFNETIAEWLHNDKTKFLKYSDKTVFPVGILSTVEISNSNSTINDKYDTVIKFEWEQIGDKTSL